MPSWSLTSSRNFSVGKKFPSCKIHESSSLWASTQNLTREIFLMVIQLGFQDDSCMFPYPLDCSKFFTTHQQPGHHRSEDNGG
jgi:hypothetical protein